MSWCRLLFMNWPAFRCAFHANALDILIADGPDVELTEGSDLIGMCYYSRYGVTKLWSKNTQEI